MALTVAYRNRMAAQFIESFVTFIFKKRKVAELLAKGELTIDEANILSHYQRDITRDRATFQIWRNLLVNEGGYTLAQIKTFLLNNRNAILELLRNRFEAEIAEINALKDQEAANAVDEAQVANLPTILAELDVRIGKRQMWHTLVIELRDMLEASFISEAEME